MRIEGQILASTEIDAHGEQRDKQFLEDLAARMPARVALNQHHDMGQPTIGFVEKLRVEREGNGWALKGDITFDGRPPAIGGFSFSTTELVHRPAEAVLVVYLPYPYYRDDDLLAELASHDGGTGAGRWIKKSIGTSEIALIVSSASFVLTPMWRRVYEDVVHPRLRSIVSAIKEALTAKGAQNVGTEFLQPVRCEEYESTIELYFIPNHNAPPEDAFNYLAMSEAIEMTRNLIRDDWARTAKPIKRVVHVYRRKSDSYAPTTITYVDGSARNVVSTVG